MMAVERRTGFQEVGPQAPSPRSWRRTAALLHVATVNSLFSVDSPGHQTFGTQENKAGGLVENSSRENTMTCTAFACLSTANTAPIAEQRAPAAQFLPATKLHRYSEAQSSKESNKICEK